MARLMITSEGFGNRVIELKLGRNRFGRNTENDFQIEHPTVSGTHCEIHLAEGEVTLKDCESTNGTFREEERVEKVTLAAGDHVRFGDVELLVETTDVTIAIPKYEVVHEAPPVVMADGGILCRRHPTVRAAWQCTHCNEVLCDTCVHRLRRRGGKALRLCPLCSHAVVQIGGEQKKKKTLFSLFQRTVRLPWASKQDGA